MKEPISEPPAELANQLTHQSLSEKFESPFDLVLHAIQLAREQIALQVSGAVVHSENIAQKVLQDISLEPQGRIEPIFEAQVAANRAVVPVTSEREEARRASSRKKRRLPKANSKA